MTTSPTFWEALGVFIALLSVLAGGAAYFVKLAISHELEQFENRFLERLNGRYLSTKVAEAIIQRADERYEAMKRDFEALSNLVGNHLR